MRPHLSETITTLKCLGPEVKSLVLTREGSHIPPNLHTLFSSLKTLVFTDVGHEPRATPNKELRMSWKRSNFKQETIWSNHVTRNSWNQCSFPMPLAPGTATMTQCHFAFQSPSVDEGSCFSAFHSHDQSQKGWEMNIDLLVQKLLLKRLLLKGLLSFEYLPANSGFDFFLGNAD